MTMLLYLSLLGVTVYGTVALLYFYNCDYVFSIWNLVVFARACVGLHWIAVAAFFTTVAFTYNPYPDHSAEASWQSRCACICCCVSDNSAGALQQPLRTEAAGYQPIARNSSPERMAAKGPGTASNSQSERVAATLHALFSHVVRYRPSE